MSPRIRNRVCSWGPSPSSPCPPPPARAQGFLIDRRVHVPIARAFEVREVAVDARIRDQVAEVQVSQTFHNPGSFQLESEYLFPLPEDGAIQNFVLMVDGKELPGRLLPKDEARRDLRGDRPHQARPGLARIHGPRALPHERLPDPPGRRPQGHDAIHAALPARPRRRRVRRTRSAPRNSPPSRSSASASNARIESRDPIKSLYSPSYDASIRRAGDHEATRQVRAARRHPVDRLPPGLHPGRRRPRRHGPELPARLGRRRLFPPAGQPRGQGAPTRSRSPRRSSSSSTARARCPARRSSRPATP